MAQTRWSARLVHTRRKERTFEVGNGSRTWIVVYQIGFSEKSDKVFVDGRAVEMKIGRLSSDLEVLGISGWGASCRFVIRGSEPNEPVAEAVFASRGYIGLEPRALALVIDGQVLHREGAFG
jgi:hypothetical protein